MLHAVGSGIDAAELCGGAARATKLAVRRKLRTGQNFDLITNVDLNNPRDQPETKKYAHENHVLVMVMAPTCGPFGPMGRLSRHMHPKSWASAYDQAAPERASLHM